MLHPQIERKDSKRTSRRVQSRFALRHGEGSMETIFGNGDTCDQVEQIWVGERNGIAWDRDTPEHGLLVANPCCQGTRVGTTITRGEWSFGREVLEIAIEETALKRSSTPNQSASAQANPTGPKIRCSGG